MLRKKVWQRGAVDLVGITVGMTILAIVTAGTAAAMVFGRELTTYEEHYKRVAFLLRGYMEEAQGELQYVPEAELRENLNAIRSWPDVELDKRDDHNGVRVVMASFVRERVDWVDIPETGDGVDYYIITVRGRWTERDGKTQELVYKTAIFAQRAL